MSDNTVTATLERAYEPIETFDAIGELRALGYNVSIGIGPGRITPDAPVTEVVSVVSSGPGGAHGSGRGPHWLQMEVGVGQPIEFVVSIVVNAMLHRVRQAMGPA